MEEPRVRLPITAEEHRLAERCARGRIVVIDDDPEILAALSALFELEHYACETYDSALAYLRASTAEPPCFPGPCCLLCDVRLPELDGLELQRCLAGHDEIPILLMSGSSGAPEAISAFRAGALDFLIKPLDDRVLLGAISRALALSAERQCQAAHRRELSARLATLTQRELEVARRVVQGQRNLRIAEAMGIGLRTVKRYRSQVMAKLQAETLVDLIRRLDESL
ncbi:MAG: response regulator transcription factor [Sphingobacteriia bacterium]|nr:response regulator transcription factor [Sphingobacteriia bacterium]NCC39818.1 response regulator transcription factor [Gammaproteobacteria bacterium]